jgi:acetyl-CoA acyltransferase
LCEHNLDEVDQMSDAYVYAAARTPFGRYGGGLSGVRPDDLAAHVIDAVLAKAPGVEPGDVDEVVLGNANGAGEDNRNVARMAVLLAGWPVSVPATTVNRLCGSGLDALMGASRMIETADADIVVAGGVESMSRAPWVVPKPSKGFPSQDGQLVSTTLGWRLVNPRMPAEWTVSLGEANEQLQEKFSISRQRQDAFAVRSHQQALAAWDVGFYDDLVTPVPGTELVRDEGIRPDASIQRLTGLKPVFRPDGTITAGNASPLNDGASALLVGSGAAATRLGLQPLARIAARAAFANEPQSFGYAPVEAARIAVRRAGISWPDVGAVELNEAFAVQSLACLDAWDIDPDLVNTKGGAIAIGHPLGASGGRIIATLAKVLAEKGQRWGVAAICIGVGQALAVVLENVATGAGASAGADVATEPPVPATGRQAQAPR